MHNPLNLSASPPVSDVAVIGAGLAGLACAGELAAAGLRPVVFDKGRGPGGRLSTRRVERGREPGADVLRFDHGAQYLTARAPEFRARMDDWVSRGVAARWDARVVRLTVGGAVGDSGGERFVGTPGMNALVRDLAGALPDPVRWGVRVMPPVRDGGAWRLTAEDGGDLGCYDRVVVAAPAPQAADLLAAVPHLSARAAGAAMAPCWTVMAAFDRPVATGWDAAFVAGEDGGKDGTEGRPLTWIARDGSKPGRGAERSLDTWVLHAGPGWSARHLEEPAEQVCARLLAAFRDLTGDGAAPAWAAAHRWRHALPTAPLDSGMLWDDRAGIGACGDWCREARAEGAWLSGQALGRDLCRSVGAAA